MILAKFNEGQAVKSTDGVEGIVKKIGDRFSKNKKGESVFETNSYIVQDFDGKIYYFLESDLIN